MKKYDKIHTTVLRYWRPTNVPMVGLCGVVGSQGSSISRLTRALQWSDEESATTLSEDGVAVGYTDHACEFDDQPAHASSHDALIWVWGTLLGHEREGTYVRREETQPDSQYCTTLYDNYGLPFVAGLNSEFSGIIYDRDQERVSIFTDRLGSRPVYYTRSSDGSVVFSSVLQTLSAHPNVNLQYNSSFLAQFLAYSRVLGVHTPVEGVEILPPGSVVTFDTDGQKVSEWQYWWPTLQPAEKPFGSFADEFTETFRDAVKERTKEDKKNGLLLSGGTDSRAVLAELDEGTVAFHMNEREESPETRTAKTVADTADAQFEYLHRGREYYPRVLNRSSRITNFNGLFRHAHPFGFEEEIRSEVDVLFCGQYSDTILGGEYVPKVDPASNIFKYLIPSGQTKPIESVQQFVTEYTAGVMGDINGELWFRNTLPDSSETVKSNLQSGSGRVCNHGVHYPSWRSAVECAMVYPISNAPRGFITYETLLQMVPTQYPFLDNRIVDLALQMPESYRNKRDVVAKSLEGTNPELASITHPNGTKPTRHYLMNNCFEHWETLRRRLGERIRDSSDEPWQVNIETDSIPDHEALIRADPFVDRIISNNREEIDQSSLLDYDDVRQLYEEHIDGADHTNALYALVTVLTATVPIDEESADAERQKHENRL